MIFESRFERLIGAGLARKYCSNACRMRDYRKRKGSKRSGNKRKGNGNGASGIAFALIDGYNRTGRSLHERLHMDFAPVTQAGAFVRGLFALALRGS